MINKIHKEVELLLKNVNWMDDQTREAALNKLKAIAIRVGYPDEIMNNTVIEKYYEKLEIDENDYVSSISNINKFDTDNKFKDLHEAINEKDWENWFAFKMSLDAVDAWNTIIGNKIGKKQNRR